jgi:putative acetyltransferase
MTVRPYTAKDFPAVCRIYADAKPDELRFESHPFEVLPLEQDDVILAAFHQSAVRVFDDGNVLGFQWVCPCG